MKFEILICFSEIIQLINGDARMESQMETMRRTIVKKKILRTRHCKRRFKYATLQIIIQ